MATNRRNFIRRTFTLGWASMTFWLETEEALGQGGAECTLPSPQPAQRFIPDEKNTVKRYSAAELAQPGHATELSNLRKAVGLVRALPPSDVTSWTKQIAQHCINCARPNPANIHYSWQFLPWHRAMLYFLERIMRKQSKVDSVRLCYWDWESPNSRVPPAIYTAENQPLYWANRNMKSGYWPLSDDLVSVQGDLMTPTFTVFGGTAKLGAPTPIAYSGPHAAVHNAFQPGDMANLQYSPRDPIFYAHHSNVDRLWSSWVEAGHKNPDFGDAKVYFYDENGVWRYVLMNDVKDERKLGYEYSSLMKSKVAPNTLHTLTLERRNTSILMAPNTVAELQGKASAPEFLLATNIQNLDKLPADTTRFGVFSASPQVGTNSQGNESFLGSFSRVLSEGHEHEASPLSATFDVTGKLSKVAVATKGNLNLTIAPLGPGGKTTAAGIPFTAENVSIIE